MIACDQPFVRVNLLHSMMAHVDCSADAIVTRTPEGLQPMSGLFHRSCFPVVEEALEHGELGMRNVLRRLSLCELTSKDLDGLDAEPTSFTNVNTREDLEAAHFLARRRPASPEGGWISARSNLPSPVGHPWDWVPTRRVYYFRRSY